MVEGERYITGQEKSNILADHFQKVLTQPVPPTEEGAQGARPRNQNRSQRRTWYPLPQARFQRFRVTEIIKAVGDLARWKAAGPDTYPIDAYRSLPALYPIIAHLFNVVMISGVTSKELLEVHIVPHDKPTKDPPPVCI